MKKPTRGPEAYRRRIDRAKAKGLSLAAARGHAKRGEPTASGRLPKDDDRLAKGLAKIQAGGSLTTTAKALGVSRERLRRAVADRGDYVRKGRRFAFVPRDTNNLPLYSDGQLVRVTVDDENASKLGAYMAAVGRFLSTNKPVYLQPFIGAGLVDVAGRNHAFEVDPEKLYELVAQGRPAFHQNYKNTA